MAGTSDARASDYAAAMLTVARAEGDQAAVEQELLSFAQALRGSEELRSTLSDAGIAAARRQQIVEDLLDGQVRAVTTALVSMAVAAGRGGDLPEIIDAVIDQAAAGRNRRVARVRSAVALSSDQQTRLAAAIKASSGLDVEIRVIVDPAVIGGVITEIGDDVIDGSVRRRIHQMRSSVG